MKKFTLLLVLLVAISLSNCTKNQRARSFGGNETVELPEGQKLIEATWKGEDLWYLTRDRREGEPVETYTFKEQSSYGLIQGTVTFNEK